MYAATVAVSATANPLLSRVPYALRKVIHSRERIERRNRRPPALVMIGL